MHTWLDTLAVVLIAVGGLNWGLVAAGRFDLVATITGDHFGETNPLNRLVYAVVGLAAIYTIVRLIAVGLG